MVLHMDLDGIGFQMRIREYKKKQAGEISEWCKTDFSLKSGDWLHYHKEDYECFENEELKVLESSLTSHLNGEMEKDETIDFAEPDFEFKLYSRTLKRANGRPYEAGGYAEMEIHFWNEEVGLTGNHLSLVMLEDEIEALRDYLRVVMGLVTAEDACVKKHRERGFFADA